MRPGILVIWEIGLLICFQINGKSEISLGQFFDRSKNLALKFECIKDSDYYGKHCFIALNGNRIDCCPDDYSLKIKYSKNQVHFGYLENCYDQKKYPLKIVNYKDSLDLIFIKDLHPFVPVKIRFYKNN
jgi:hypothetical protein